MLSITAVCHCKETGVIYIIALSVLSGFQCFGITIIIVVGTVTVKPAMFQIITQLEAPTLSEGVTEMECPVIVSDIGPFSHVDYVHTIFSRGMSPDPCRCAKHIYS